MPKSWNLPELICISVIFHVYIIILSYSSQWLCNKGFLFLATFPAFEHIWTNWENIYRSRFKWSSEKRLEDTHGWNIIELNQTDLTAYIRHRHLPIYTYVQDWIIPLSCTLDRSCGILDADFSCLILDTDCQPREFKRRPKEKTSRVFTGRQGRRTV